MKEYINYDSEGKPWVWMRPEICAKCKDKCVWWTYHYGQHKIYHYEMKEVRLYIDLRVQRAAEDKNDGCPYLLEHVISQDGSQLQIDDRRPLHDRCRNPNE
jgi:hypothetical protein